MRTKTLMTLAAATLVVTGQAQFNQGVLTGLRTERQLGTNTMTTTFAAGAAFQINGNSYTIIGLDSFLIVGSDLTAGASLSDADFSLGQRLNSLNGQVATWSQGSPFRFTDVSGSSWNPVRNPGSGSIVNRAGWDAKGNNRIDTPLTGGGSIEWSIASLRPAETDDFFAYHVVFDRKFEGTSGNTAFIRGLDAGGASAPVPEPGTIAALGLGAVALLRRRQK